MSFSYKKINLTTKLSILVVISILASFATLGFYFDSFLKDTHFQNTKKRMILGLSRVSINIENIDKELKQGISFIDKDESLLASIDLINNYQDKNNYSAVLLDEEKKSILIHLLKKVKLSLNDDISLYGEDEELIAFVTKEADGFYQHFFSFDSKGKILLFTKHEFDEVYKIRDIEDKRLVDYKHKAYYEIKKAGIKPVITHHIENQNVYVKAHKYILSHTDKKIIAHIEMTHIYKKQYLDEISKDLDLNLSFSTAKKYSKDSINLFDKEKYENITIIQTDDQYKASVHLNTSDGSMYIVSTLNKKNLNTRLTENRTELIYILLLTIAVMLIILRNIFNKSLTYPLEILMKQIDKIEDGDYSKSKELHSGDELQTISKNINTLSSTIRSREADLKKSQEDFEHLSNHDPLTNLPNRRLFNDRLNQALLSADRNKTKVAVLFLDLDGFKDVNDSLGHDVGDELLVQVAHRLKIGLRNVDTLARIGGDEFHIILEDISDIFMVNKIVKKILEKFDIKFSCLEDSIKVTTSIGIAIYPDDGKDAASIVKHADLAMYQSKDLGRDRYSFFSRELELGLSKRIKWLTAMKEAVQKCDEFYLLYQPKISSKTGKIVAIEALIRWDSSVLGFVGPDQFISLAEESDLIVPLGQWILNQACSDFVKLQKEGFILDYIAINVSSMQLIDSNMLSNIKNVITETGISPNSIEIEITESYIATDEEKVFKTLQALRDMNLNLAIDDFGTGYSSLSYLQKLPVTRLKIDKSFVDDLPESKESVAVAKAIIALAKTFNLAITAEGVETKEQLEFLQEEDCDDIQGYYYSKPITLEELEVFYKLNK